MPVPTEAYEARREAEAQARVSYRAAHPEVVAQENWAETLVPRRVNWLMERGWDPKTAVTLASSSAYTTPDEFRVLTRGAERLGMGRMRPSDPPRGFWDRFNDIVQTPWRYVTGEDDRGNLHYTTDERGHRVPVEVQINPLTGQAVTREIDKRTLLADVTQQNEKLLRPIVGLIPEDVRQGAKTVLGEAKAVTLGGTSPVTGEEIKGALPEFEEAAKAVIGPPVRYLQAGTQELVAQLQDLGDLLDPTGLFKGGKHPDVPSPKRAVQDALNMSFGEQLAVQQGFKRGSDPFNVMKATGDAVFQTAIYAEMGNVAKGLELAGTVPAVGAATGETLGLRGVRRTIYDLFAKSPEELLDTPAGRRTVAHFERLGAEGNVSRIVELHPEFAQMGPDGVTLAQELVADPSAAHDLLVAGMHGDVTPMSRFRAQARLKAIESEKGQILGATMTPEEFVTRARTAEELPAQSLEHMAQALRSPVGQPGITLEQAVSAGEDVPRLKELVWRDQEGTPRGIVEFSLDEQGHVASVTASVDPAYRGQFLTEQMIGYAKEQGYDLESQIMGSELLTEKGARATHRVIEARYGQLDPATARAQIHTLEAEQRAIEQRLVDNRGQFILRNLPSANLGAQIKDFVSRLPSTEEQTLTRQLAQVFDKTWPRRFAQVLPEPSGIPVFDKPAGINEVRRWGELVKLPRERIDAYVNRYVASTSQGEVSDIVNDILKEGNLPQRLRSQITQRVENPAGSTYGYSEGGRELNQWAYEVPGAPGQEAVMYHQPIYESQLAARVPVPNPRDVLEAGLLKTRYREWGLKWAKMPGAAGTLVKTVAVTPLDAYLGAKRWTSTLTSMWWKPSVLLRLGWPVKVVALDEQARLAAHGVPSLWWRPWDNLAINKLFTSPAQLFRGQVDLAAPEDVFVNWGREHLMQTPRQSKLAFGNRGFGEALAEELSQASASPTMRQLARTDVEATKVWLRTTKAGRQAAEDMRPVLSRLGKSTDEWVDFLDTRMETIARTPELRRAVATGRLEIEGTALPLSAGDVADRLQALPRTDVPGVVRDLRPVYRRETGRQWIDTMMRWLGNAPTNYLSRSQAFRSFYERDLRSLLARGIDRDLAERAAKDWAVDTTNALLYNVSQKTAFDALHEQLVPFFPAWKEVLRVWSTQIPEALGGPVFGHISLLGRAKAMGQLGQAFGLIRQDPETGQQLLSLGGLKIPLTRLAMFGTLPGFGPLPTAALGIAAKQSKAIEDMLKPIQQYGPEISLGPQFLNRAYLSVFHHPAPWEVFSQRYQQAQWDLAYLRNMQRLYPQLKRRLKAGEDQEQVLGELKAEAEEATSKEFFYRMLTGFVLPAAPLRISADEDQLRQLRKKAAGITGSEAQAERKALYDRFAAEHPELEGFLTSRSYRVKGEQKLEQGREAWWRDWRNGAVKIYDPDTFGNVLAVGAEYDLIRTQQRENVNKVGATAVERLQNYWQVQQASKEAALQQEILREQNPQWAEAWDRILKNAAERKGKPTPDATEQVILRLNRLLGLVPLLMKGQENEIDFDKVRQVQSQIAEVVKEFNDYTKTSDMPPGPDRDVAEYFDKIFGPYLDARAARYDKLKMARTSEDVSAIMDGVRRFNDSQMPQIIAGQKMPTPEEVLYAMIPPAQRVDKQRAWTMQKIGWLTAFQRRAIGLADSAQAKEFWQEAADADQAYRQYTQTVSSSSKAAQAYRDSLDSWKRSEAVRLGIGRDYTIATQQPYARLFSLGLVQGRTWTKVAYVVGQAQTVLDHDGVGWSSKEGKAYAQTFYRWIEDYRRYDQAFSDDLDRLREVASDRVQRPWDKFYSYLFLTGSVF